MLNTANITREEFAELQAYENALGEMLTHFNDIPPKCLATINQGAVEFEQELNKLSGTHTWQEILRDMKGY